ncbi:ESCRT-II subunit protein snf8 [Entomophthora muscae]|uniref:ESCRT-II subunit protein snf8 n=2 Tax=Entomophthora muscae TaxID=34485 RepID=A0ACC2SH79_9FUNG|nr:ESCRT-II subunit protein snf8 [Entomophthora muscae]
MAFRRTGVGKLALSRQQGTQAQYRQKGESLEATQLAALQEQFSTFQTNLANFAYKYRKDIKNDPIFRQYFQRMCNQIGVDPLASSKGFWAEILGVGDFYYELGIQIIEICLLTRSFNGGLIEMRELLDRLQNRRRRPNLPLALQEASTITEDDVARSLKTLKPLGGQYQLVTIGSRKLITSVPKELDADQNLALAEAQGTGYVTEDSLSVNQGWSVDRCQKTLNNLVRDGLCWVDYYSEPASYWVVAYFK